MRFTAWAPPASDMTSASWPCGLTSSMSMSSGHEWLSPFRTRFTSVIVPERPEIEQVDGYGSAVSIWIVIGPPQ